MDYFYRSDSSDWPFDSADHVFLARACARLGKAMFGDRWGLRAPVPEGDDTSDDDIDVYHDWEVLDDRLEAESVEMIRSVQDQIAVWARSGQLKTALRARAGGALTAQSATVWNTERYRHRFADCEMSLREPFRISEDGSHYIFVELNSFEACLREIARRDPLPQPLPKPAKTPYKLNATRDALAEILSDHQTANLTPDQLLRKVNQKLGRGREVSKQTLGRALKDLRK